MTGIALAGVQSLVVAGICVFLWRTGRLWPDSDRLGRRLLLAGFALLLAASLMEVAQGLDRLPEAGGTLARVASLAGFFLAGLGLARWLAVLRSGMAGLDAAADRTRRDWRQLSEAVEDIAAGVALFDADGRQVFTNRRFREELAGVLDDPREEPGVAGLLRGMARADARLDGEAEQAAWVETRLAELAGGGGAAPFEIQRDDGRACLVRALRTGDGGVALDCMDVTALRQTERALYASEMALWESEQRFSGVLESAGDAIFVHDMEGRMVQVNQSACDILGYSRSALLKLGIFDIWDDYEPEVLRRIWQGLEAGRPLTLESAQRREDGSTVPTEVRVSLYQAGDRRLVVASARDTSERRRQEEALARAEQLLKDAIDSLHDGFVLWDPQDRLVRCNQAYRELFRVLTTDLVPGAAYDDLMRKLYRRGEVVTGESEAAWMETMSRLHTACDHSREVALADGRVLLVSERPTSDGGRVGLLMDVTEVARARETIRESEARFRSLVETTSDWVWEVDETGVYTYSSPQSLAILGYAPDEMVGRAPTDFMPDDEAERVRAAVEPLFRDRRPIERLENVNLGKDGRQVVLETSGTPVFDAEGRFRGYRGIDRDVTERKRKEAQLLRTKEEAELANRAKSEFLTNMSHEFRTPLNAVIGFSQVALSEAFGPLEEHYRDYYQGILDAGRHLLDIMEDILDVARMETDIMDLEEGPVEVGTVVHSALKMVQSRAERGRKKVLEQVEGDLPAVWGDRRRLRQILVNLLSNAVKFTPEGGEVRVEAHVDDDGALVLSVRDTGIGMAPDELAKALQPFQQVEGGMDRHHDGAGLGLYLTDRLVRMHGGTLDIRSAKGHGTTATIRFPAARMAEERPATRH